MDSYDFLLHQPFQVAEAAMPWVECKSDYKDITWFNGQKGLPCTNTATPESQRRGVKRRIPEFSLSRASSLVSGVQDYPIQQQLLQHGHNDFPVALPSVAQKTENNSFSFLSPAHSFSNEEIIHPCGSAFSFASPLHCLSNEDVANPECGSPDTSITTEYHPCRSTSYSPHNFNQPQKYRPYGSFTKFAGREELVSVQLEFPCSDGSSSSEVVFSPDRHNNMNTLMDSFLYDLSQVEGCGENHSSMSASQIQIIRQNNLQQQHPPLVESFIDPMGCVSTKDDSQTQDSLQYKERNSCFSAEICSLQQTSLWENQKTAIGTADHIWPEGERTQIAENTSCFPTRQDSIRKPQNSDHSKRSECLIMHAYDQQLLDNVQQCAESLDPAKSPKHELDVLCHIIGEAAHKLDRSEEGFADDPSQVKQVEDQARTLDFQGSGDQTRTLDFQGSGLPFAAATSDADYNGIRLVHLLIASAEAVASRDMDLAAVILARLKELVFRTGNTMQRVASYFTDGLQYRIEGGRALDRATVSSESHGDILTAFQILHEMSPYIKFGHLTANQAILEVIEGERRVHIVDYEIMEGIQWPSLMEALSSRPGGAPHLRITAIYRAHAKRGLATTQETGKRLTEFAASLNLPFTFNQVRVDNDDDFRPSVLKIVRGETLVVNCMLHLPHMPHKTITSISSFLQGIRKLSPAVVTLVEDELGCTTSAFTPHFFEALHHYSAMFDSLEASLTSQTTARALVERVFFAPRIISTVTFCGSASNWETGRTVQAKRNWNSLVIAAGFKPLPLSFYNLCQARLLLGLFKDGFKLDEDNNRLLLGWRCKPLIAASAWSCK